MNISYKANINDFLNHSNNFMLENNNYSNNEIDRNYRDNYKDQENEEKEKIKKNVHLISNKRTKIIDDSIDISLKKKRKLDKNLYKPPTVEELNELRETENLFHSNLFRLQIEEMLNEIKVKEKYKRLFDIWFKNFKKNIESIKETEEYKISDQELKNKLNMHIPMPKVPEETKGMFKFLKPSDIAIIGSYMFDAAISPNITVDIMIEMPAKMFQKQDYQNYRYMKKKAIYLAFIAFNITDDIAKSKTFMNDNSRPFLKIVPNGKLGTKMNVFIHISVQEGSFKLSRLLPEKNNVRSEWFFNEEKITEDLLPTPHYNSIILHDLTMKIHAENMKIIKEYPNLRDGIILLKIWLIQRGLSKGCTAFNGYVITMFILYLLSIKKLNTFMSSYQIIRNAWNYLVQVDWCESGVTMNQNEDNKNRIFSYHKYYDCVFLDSTGYYNITTHIFKSTYKWIQKEAQLSLNHLDSAHANSFQSLFMRKVPFYMAFDHFIWFEDPQILKNIVNINSSDKDKLNYGPNYRTQIIKILYNIFEKGLTNRVHQICVLPKEISEWEFTEDNYDNIGKIFFGLELNPEHCFNIVTKGPEANLPEAIEFRKFWNKKSELRRFQDGTIREAVIWSKGKTLSAKRIICKKIINFLLTKKLGFPKNKFTYIADQVEELIKLQKDGFVFRLRISHQKEISCLKQQVTENGVVQYKDNEESIELENRLFELPKLTSALHGLHTQQPSFGAACCLTKRWLSAQLLDDSHIPDIVVELLVASIFLIPTPYRSSQTPQVKFLRVLEMFARGHWNTDPIIVNFNDEMSKEDIIAVETLFGSSRDSLPPLFISTPYDQQRSLWTKKAPSILVLNRITMLAKQCIKLYEVQFFTKVLLDFKPLFRPPLTEYDCLIYLKSHMIPRRLQAVDINDAHPIIEWHPYKRHSAQKIPVVGFDPVQYFLKDLRNGYDEFALFFHDTYGGNIIGVLLKPSALENKDFKISNINGRKCNNNNQLVLNISAMIQDFYILGKDLVEAIDMQSKKFSLI
ncbi:nucleolar protein 6 isoform X2 [Apis cerana]|uniref:nucleolar protein 6 isoform X2 n=1 Tax=Apis cerana TaxID=7461 RepID=UPI002B22E4A9|nr:nucleolar protein 6 isoform X2 [Apis cerana]